MIKTSFKKIAKVVAQQTIGRLPPPASRLTGLLARDGGKRVRDTRLRPWADSRERNGVQWLFRVGPALRKVFASGVEGVPQALAKQFAEQWAEYCGCRFGLLLPHGTDALRIALAAVLHHDGLDYGGEIIVPNLSFIATAGAALDRRLGWSSWMSKQIRSCSIPDEWRKQLSPGRLGPSCRFIFLANRRT